MADPLGIIGQTIAGKYRVVALAGTGGFSAVYRAEHELLQQPVAIKCFTALAAAPEHERERLLEGFILEGKLMAELSARSPAVVQARDVGTFTSPAGDWVPFMVLEWLSGTALDVVLEDEQRARLPARSLAQTMDLLEPIVVGLDLAHGRGVAHRDVKPGNILVLGGDARAPSAPVKLLDFGIAKIMVEHASTAVLAQTGWNEITSFTPGYGAPEQFSRTHGATGPWTDVFAFALVMVEMLRGGAPVLEGEDVVAMSVRSRDPSLRPTPSSFGIDLGPAVDAVFRRALAVSTAERYATIGAFWSALGAAVAPDAPPWSASTLHRYSPRTTRRAPFESTASTDGTYAASAAPPATPCPRRRFRAILAGVVAVAAASIATIAVRSDGPPTRAESALGAQRARLESAPEAERSPVTSCPEGMVLLGGAADPAQPELCLDARAVTAAEYKACSDVGECKRPSAGLPDECRFNKPGRQGDPINCLSWELADAYCRVLGKRLPSEADWALAADGAPSLAPRDREWTLDAIDPRNADEPAMPSRTDEVGTTWREVRARRSRGHERAAPGTPAIGFRCARSPAR